MINYLFFNSFFLQLTIAKSFSFLGFLCSIYECVPWTLWQRGMSLSVWLGLWPKQSLLRFCSFWISVLLIHSKHGPVWAAWGFSFPPPGHPLWCPFLSFFPGQILESLCMYVKARRECHLRYSSLNLELINPAKLTEQRAPGSFCFLLPGAEITSIAHHAQFYCGSWWLNSGPLACVTYSLIHDPNPVLCIFKQSQLKGVTVHFCLWFV